MGYPQNGSLNHNYRHGLHGCRLYNTWKTMRQRCSNPNNRRYKYYGARGVKVCEEWDDFAAFYEWAMANGYKEDLTIERIDINHGYNPLNCRWISMDEQARNTSRNIFITVDGVTQIQSVWSRVCGIDNSTLSKLRRNGADIEDILRRRIFAYDREPKEDA